MLDGFEFTKFQLTESFKETIKFVLPLFSLAVNFKNSPRIKKFEKMQFSVAIRLYFWAIRQLPRLHLGISKFSLTFKDFLPRIIKNGKIAIVLSKICLTMKISIDCYKNFGNCDFAGALHPIPKYLHLGSQDFCSVEEHFRGSV